MKTPMQDMLEWVRATLPMDLDWPMLIEEKVKSLIQKEKDVMCDFVEYCDEANRNYQETEESWCDDLTIDDMFDKRFNTKEK